MSNFEDELQFIGSVKYSLVGVRARRTLFRWLRLLAEQAQARALLCGDLTCWELGGSIGLTSIVQSQIDEAKRKPRDGETDRFVRGRTN